MALVGSSRCCLTNAAIHITTFLIVGWISYGHVGGEDRQGGPWTQELFKVTDGECALVFWEHYAEPFRFKTHTRLGPEYLK